MMDIEFPENRAGNCYISNNRICGRGRAIHLKDRVKSIEVTSRSGAKNADSKLGRAAAGAALGFFVAGPIGTIVGAGSGAVSARGAKGETFGVTVRFVDHEFLIGEVDEFELEELRRNLVSEDEPRAAKGMVSTADELIKLVELRDAGALSDEEFAAAKARLLV